MKIFVLVFLLTMPSLSQAETTIAFPSVDPDAGTVTYEYFVQLGFGEEVLYNELKAVHFGKRETMQQPPIVVFQHPQHEQFQDTIAGPMAMTHLNPLPTFALIVGTRRYCSVLNPFSELTGSGGTKAIVFSGCENICYDVCTNC